MNSTEPESSPSGPSGLQVELGAKSNRHFRMMWLLPLFGLLALGSVALIAWSPNSSPTPSLSPSVAAQPSRLPRIRWSENQLEVILSPGESATRSLTFISDQNLQNIVLEPVQELAPFVSIQPNSFANVLAGQPQSVELMVSIPQGATLGPYDGIVHVRLGSQTLPQTLKVVILIWKRITEITSGLSFALPPEMESAQGEDSVIVGNTNDATLPPVFVAFVVDISPDLTPQLDMLSPSQALEVIARGQLGSDFLRLVSFHDNGIEVEASTLAFQHFLIYDKAQRRSLHFMSGRAGIFTSPDFQRIVRTVVF